MPTECNDIVGRDDRPDKRHQCDVGHIRGR
jgi:hypothetical protein